MKQKRYMVNGRMISQRELSRQTGVSRSMISRRLARESAQDIFNNPSGSPNSRFRKIIDQDGITIPLIVQHTNIPRRTVYGRFHRGESLREIFETKRSKQEISEILSPLREASATDEEIEARIKSNPEKYGF